MWRAALVLLLLTSCQSDQQAIVVGVASSLADVGEALGRGFDGSPIDLSVAGSQVLVTQVREGAPLDVAIAADLTAARDIADAGSGPASPVRVAGNRLAIAVAEGNPLGIEDLADLTDPALTVVLAGPEVPAGRYTTELLRAAGVAIPADSLEPSVRGVLTKVRLGEADAGIVYATDILTGGVTGITLDPGPDVSYYAVALREGSAEAFVDYLTSPEASDILRAHGFAP